VSASPVSSEHLGTVELRIPARPEWVAVARLAVAAIANRLPFSVEEIEDLKLAIAEACTMCIQHASEHDAIDISYEAGGSYVQISCRDHRYAGTVMGPATGASGLQSEGLGAFLVEALMDEFSSSFDPERGTELLMVKRVGS